MNRALLFCKKKELVPASIGIVLGTGMYELIAQMTLKKSIAYAEIPHFPEATQEFQKGMLHYGSLGGKKVLVFQGRYHLYEGLSFFEITYFVRIFKALGGKSLLLSNAAGTINLHFKKGSLMLIEDHINLQGGSPLALKGIETLGERFVDMSMPYDLALREKVAQHCSSRKNKPLPRGLCCGSRTPVRNPSRIPLPQNNRRRCRRYV